MCGIFGAAFADGIGPDRLNLLREGTANLTHRGPDHGGEAVFDRVFLGHRRLSIIDLSANANQPLHAREAPVSLVFNGEIYNFQALLGHLSGFESQSDSETLLEGYLRFGTSFFEKLRGIYAFAIYDRRQQGRCLLVRDPAGVKPLYVHLGSDKLAFGSEIKALWPLLRPELNLSEATLKAYLHLGYCPEPATIYREIRCVTPGHILEVDLNNFTASEKPFFGYDFNRLRRDDPTASREMAKAHLATAVARNLVADVPVSISLSGGIDSSLIFALANQGGTKREGLTVRFEDRAYDESDVAGAFAKHLGAPHQVIDGALAPSMDLLDRVFLHFDQPYADSSALPFYFLAKAARQIGKVLIGGDGGDEAHDGYKGHGVLPELWRWTRPPFLNRPAAGTLRLVGALLGPGRARQLRRLAGVVTFDHPADRLFEWTGWFPAATRYSGRSPFLFQPEEALALARETLLIEEDATPDQWVRAFYFQQRMRSDYLRKSDMMSMFHGLEYRVPMLDEDFVTHALAIPPKQKATVSEQKRILRGLHKEIYPKALSQRPKTGFTIPLDSWLGAKGLEKMREWLTMPGAFVHNWIAKDYIHQLFDEQNVASGQISRAARYQRLLILYNLENWYRTIYARR